MQHNFSFLNFSPHTYTHSLSVVLILMPRKDFSEDCVPLVAWLFAALYKTGRPSSTGYLKSITQSSLPSDH